MFFTLCLFAFFSRLWRVFASWLDSCSSQFLPFSKIFIKRNCSRLFDYVGEQCIISKTEPAIKFIVDCAKQRCKHGANTSFTRCSSKTATTTSHQMPRENKTSQKNYKIISSLHHLETVPSNIIYSWRRKTELNSYHHIMMGYLSNECTISEDWISSTLKFNVDEIHEINLNVEMGYFPFPLMCYHSC